MRRKPESRAADADRKPFDRVAGGYDAFMRFWGFYKDSHIASLLGLRGDETLIDVGGGTGHLAGYLSPFCGNITVLDESPRMLSRVPPGPNIRTIAADALSPGLPGASFDVAILSDVLHHVRDQRALFSEIRRLLKPGGRVLVNDFDRSAITVRLLGVFEALLFGRMLYRTRGECEAMLREAGFSRLGERVDGASYLLLWEKGETPATDTEAEKEFPC